MAEPTDEQQAGTEGQRRRGRMLIALASVVVVAVIITVAVVLWRSTAGKHSPTATAASASPSLPPTVVPSEAAAKDEILRRYKAYLDLQHAADTSGVYDPNEFHKYLGSPLEERVIYALYTAQRNGTVYRGTVTNDPKVTKVDLAASPQTATVTDCIDNTNYLPVYKATNSPAPMSSGSRRFVSTATATFVSGRGWLFTDGFDHREQRC